MSGRLLTVNIFLGNITLTLMGVYGLTQSHGQDQVILYETLAARVRGKTPDSREHIIICGDCNVHLNPTDAGARTVL